MHRWGNKKDMAGDDPPFLAVGTEVSAKYKGAFCEAKIRKVVKAVKCKVQLKNESGSVFVSDEQIKGFVVAGSSIEVKPPDKKDYVEGTIIKIQDLSQYTVVFDDGDIATLRRTALCLKSGRHFAEGETLDKLPLTHPEHFSTPVVSGIRGSRRRDEMEDNSDDESKRERKVEREEDMGKVVRVEISDKKKSKDNWFPGLIVAPNAQDSVKIDVEDEYLVRSFKDGRYYTVPKRETVDFTRDVGAKADHPTLKMAVEKAISFMDKDDLPPHWDRDVLFGMADYTSESDDSDTDSTDDQPREEKDHFVAQLYKFMDDRGTPINKGPMISAKDVDLYKLFKIVNKLGGYNRVTNRNQWKGVTAKLGYSTNQTNNVKTSYKKYLHNFEDFYRKLGCTMLSHNAGNKPRGRSSRPLIRDRDKSLLEKNAEKEENNSIGDESQEGRELQNDVKTKIESQVKDEIEIDDKQKELKKESQKVKKELNVENVKDDDKVKKNNVKLDNTTVVKDAVQPAPVIAPKEPKIKPVKSEDVKDDKIVGEKKSERKVVKTTPKTDFNDSKKGDKPSVKTKMTKLKGVEKRIKKNDNVLPNIRTKRSLKERMKAIVKRLKLKSGVSSSEQDKKKQKFAEEENKGSPQLYKIKNKEDILNNGTKTRKLSVGSDGKNVIGFGNSDRKSTGSSTSGGNTSDGGNSVGTGGRYRKNDDDSSEGGPKKKTYSRRKKDEDKYSSNSNDSLINQSIDIVSPHKTICIGDKLKVYYGPTHESKVTYEAKVMNKRYGAVTEYFVHYTGWNTRYDEWIRRSRIAEDLSWTPARDKLKFNQIDAQPISQLPSQVDQQTQPNQNMKTATEKIKRSSISPVGKIRSKSVTKSVGRPGRIPKSKSPTKFDLKGKKIASKDSDSSDDSENESNQKPSLQKTRSRTEKQKQQDEDSSSKDSKDSDTKTKKPPPLKRTRSGSLKLESKEEPTKKRKVTPIKANKTSRTNAIRNSIMKNLVPRKRMAEKGKKLFKKKDQLSDKNRNDFETKSIDKLDESLDMDVKEDVDSRDDEKGTEKSAPSLEEIEKMNCEETQLVLKIKPFPAPNAVIDETDDISVGEMDKIEVTEMKEKSTSIDADDTGPPVLKKEILSDDDATSAPSSTNQFLADSYLAENLDKPKVVKAKLKKETEEKSPPSTSKIFNRSSPSGGDKSATKAGCDVKEKTFFTSRIDKLEAKKGESTDKDKKDNKIRNVSSFSSYLSMDKIDSIRKTTPEKNAEKTSPTQKFGEDDIYEFKEPEPFEFRGIDDRTILHRRPTSRIFDEAPFKRGNKVTSSPNDSGKDDETSKLAEENDTKTISETIGDENNEKDNENVTKIADSENNDTVASPKTKDISQDVENVENDENFEKTEPVTKLEIDVEVSTTKTIEVCAQMGDVVSKELFKIDSTVESSLYRLQCEDEDDEDVDEEKLIISENDQLGDNAIFSESITSKIVGSKVNEVSVAIRDADEDEKSLDLDKFIVDKNTGSIESPVEDIKKLKSLSEPVTNKLSMVPSTKEENEKSTDNVPKEKSVDDEIMKKLRADENLDSDDDSISSAKSSLSSGDKDLKGSGESDSAADKDEEYLSSDSTSAISGEHLTVKKQEHAVKTYSSDSSSSVKKKVILEAPKIVENMDVDTSCNDLPDNLDVNETIIQPGIIDEVEIEIFTPAKKDSIDQIETKIIVDSSEKESNKASKEENKAKDDDDDDGLLLCEETIPKSPETKDTSSTNDCDIPYPSGSGINDGKKLPEKNAKVKKGPRPSPYSAAATVFENTPPTTPEGSTPGNSPSDEHNGFSSTSFSLNEKPPLNKDSSENDTYSDNSERSLRTKRFRDENETYHKKNSYEYDSYLKRKSGKDNLYKNEEPSKKKTKAHGPASANESEKDDFSDEGNSPKSGTLSQKFTKSSYYVDLDPDLDPNQRIEILEQKLQELRKAYLALKQELSSIDKRRKKLRRREREGRMMTRNEANSLL